MKDPRAILSAAAPFYDFSDPTLKPWHLKATYQLYDEKGNPSEQGTFEYWWASPKVHRASWSRPGVSESIWFTDGDKEATVKTGGPLDYFERGVESNLLSPLPSPEAIDPAKTRLILNNFKTDGLRLPCISESSIKGEEPSNFRMLNTDCFDSVLPILRLEFSAEGIVSTIYNNFVKFQGKYLARAIQIMGGDQKLFTASVDSIGLLDPADPALVPPKDALLKPDTANLNENLASGSLAKKQVPIYPTLAKAQRIQGSVLVEATIGVDGKIKDSRVILSPSPLLSASSLEAISHWEYKPYLKDGVPTEVETLIAVEFTLRY
jgi:TonB family protein